MDGMPPASPPTPPPPIELAEKPWSCCESPGNVVSYADEELELELDFLSSSPPPPKPNHDIIWGLIVPASSA